MAVNCSVCPLAIEGEAGVTAMLCKTTDDATTTPADPLIVPEEALIVLFPADKAEASPVELTVATAGFDELQLTKLVMFDVTPPVKVPVAVNCCCDPVVNDALAGLTVIADSPERVPLPESGTD